MFAIWLLLNEFCLKIKPSWCMVMELLTSIYTDRCYRSCLVISYTQCLSFTFPYRMNNIFWRKHYRFDWHLYAKNKWYFIVTCILCNMSVDCTSPMIDKSLLIPVLISMTCLFSLLFWYCKWICLNRIWNIQKEENLKMTWIWK